MDFPERDVGPARMPQSRTPTNTSPRVLARDIRRSHASFVCFLKRLRRQRLSLSAAGKAGNATQRSVQF